jgi:hypothetical protein
VTSGVEHGLDSPGDQGKHIALECDREQQILDDTRQNAESNTPVTRKENKESWTSQFQGAITRIISCTTVYLSDYESDHL